MILASEESYVRMGDIRAIGDTALDVLPDKEGRWLDRFTEVLYDERLDLCKTLGERVELLDTPMPRLTIVYGVCTFSHSCHRILPKSFQHAAAPDIDTLPEFPFSQRSLSAREIHGRLRPHEDGGDMVRIVRMSRWSRYELPLTQVESRQDNGYILLCARVVRALPRDTGSEL